MNAFIIFPGNYYKDIKNLINCNVYLYKLDDKKFSRARKTYFNKCLKFYADYLKRQKIKTTIIKKVSQVKEPSIVCYDPVDAELSRELKPFNVQIIESKTFITTRDEIMAYYKEVGSLNQTKFYKWQRVRFNILMDHGKPQSSRLTYDIDNRKPLTARDPMRKRAAMPKLAYTFDSAAAMLRSFVARKLAKFGDYQDAAIIGGNPMLYHSGLSAPLNMGLITPYEVIDAALASGAPLNSVEGFVRQILGWREHCRLIYLVANLEGLNALSATRKLSRAWFTGRLNSKISVLNTIVNKGWRNGYLHHIERLMIIGAYMLMIGIEPTQAKSWFYNMSCDAFDWNMVPNVYGMALYVAGTKSYVSKPYFSSSRYLINIGLKLSKRDSAYWDALYWEFVRRTASWMSHNGRLAVQVANLARKTSAEKESYAKLVSRL